MISRHIQYVYKEGIYDLYTGENPVNFVGGSPVIIRGYVSGYGQASYGPPFDWALEPIPLVDGVVFNEDNPTTILGALPVYLGVAYHSRKVCELTKKVTVIKAPAIVKIFKGKARMKEFQQAEEFFPFGFTEDDPYYPFDPDEVASWTQGTLLVPGAVEYPSGSGIYYSVWKTANASNLGVTSGSIIFTAPARVLEIVNASNADDCIVTIELGAFSVEISVPES